MKRYGGRLHTLLSHDSSPSRPVLADHVPAGISTNDAEAPRGPALVPPDPVHAAPCMVSLSPSSPRRSPVPCIQRTIRTADLSQKHGVSFCRNSTADSCRRREEDNPPPFSRRRSPSCPSPRKYYANTGIQWFIEVELHEHLRLTEYHSFPSPVIRIPDGKCRQTQ